MVGGRLSLLIVRRFFCPGHSSKCGPVHAWIALRNCGVYDHVHKSRDDEGRPYEFVSAGKLIEDFWVEVERIMREEER